MSRLLVLPLALSALLAFSTGCSSKGPDMTGQSTAGFYAPDYEMLWDIGRKEMNNAGYPPDRENSDKPGRKLVSRWKVSLHPFSHQGWREQATLYFHPVEGRDGYWTVEANVVRQTNTNEKNPTDAARAEWDAGVRVPDRETRLVYGVESFFVGHEVSPQFRTNYGMQGAPPPVTPVPSTPK